MSFSIKRILNSCIFKKIKSYLLCQSTFLPFIIIFSVFFCSYHSKLWSFVQQVDENTFLFCTNDSLPNRKCSLSFHVTEKCFRIWWDRFDDGSLYTMTMHRIFCTGCIFVCACYAIRTLILKCNAYANSPIYTHTTHIYTHYK